MQFTLLLVLHVTFLILHKNIEHEIDYIGKNMYNIAVSKGADEMEQGYTKLLYDHNPGFRLHHTKGQFAGKSTTGHPHYEVELSFIYFLHGSGEIKIEGKKHSIEDGDLILLKPSELCHCTVSDMSYHERLTVYFNESLLKNFNESGRCVLEPFCKRKDGFENIIPAARISAQGIDCKIRELLNTATKRDKISQIVSVCKLIEILAKLGTEITEASLQPGSQSVTNPLINEVIAYINQNFRQEIHLDDIANTFFVDKYYLSHLFREQVGVTVWNYVIFRRLTAVNDMIRANTSVEQACFRAGFQNYSNFFRLYKKHMQMTPAQFKKHLIAHKG